LTVTVVICTRNRPALLEKCLAAVQNLSPSPDVILVVDNTHGDAETKRITDLFGARYLVEPRPGMNHARKRALADRETDMMAFLSDDVTPANDWLASLLPNVPTDDPEDAADPEEDVSVGPVIH
jgi:glycosyltransferase involved in cell wall biosynthesis